MFLPFILEHLYKTCKGNLILTKLQVACDCIRSSLYLQSQLAVSCTKPTRLRALCSAPNKNSPTLVAFSCSCLCVPAVSQSLLHSVRMSLQSPSEIHTSLCNSKPQSNNTSSKQWDHCWLCLAQMWLPLRASKTHRFNLLLLFINGGDCDRTELAHVLGPFGHHHLGEKQKYFVKP